MIHRLWVVCGLVVVLGGWANFAEGQTSHYHRYIIEFTDKADSPYSLSEPETFLSPRALQRRQRLGLALDETDLPVNPHYLEAVASTGVRLLYPSKWLNAVTIETDDSLALQSVQALPFVKKAEPIAQRQSGRTTSKRPLEAQQEPVRPENYGTAWHQLQMMQGSWLHNSGFQGQGIYIALMDAGWYNTQLLDVFDSLYAQHRILGTWNFVDHNDNVYSRSTHGTSVLSTMAANLPGVMIGTAPQASYFLFLTEDVFSEYPIEEFYWAVAAERADSLGVDVISSSLGYTLFDDPRFDYTYADMDGRTALSSRAADMAVSKGILVCSSAGNYALQPWHYISAPADAAKVLSVGATDSTATITYFSSHGPTFDGRIKPDVIALGIRAYVVDPALQDSSLNGTNSKTYPSNGTSFSGPIVAGLTACLVQKHYNHPPADIVDAIRKSASMYTAPNDSFGYGVPNFAVADLILSNRFPETHPEHAPVIYPNPFTGQTGILWYSESQQTAQLQVFDITGRRLFAFTTTFQHGQNYLLLNQFQNFPSGYYFIHLEFNERRMVLAVTKSDP